MGYGRWNANDWDTHAKATQGKSTQQIFNAASMKPAMDPRQITLRESRDSAKNPSSTPIVLALDVTGSMGMIADHLARKGLGDLVQEILDRKPVPDPHIMVMGVGDAVCDRAPLQVSQFEADIRISDQLKDIYLEGGGGGNRHESYTLPWYFAAKKTDIDCVKRGKKGVLFTFGDEECPPDVSAAQIRAVLGDTVSAGISTADLLKEVSQKYDVYHVVIEQGNYARSNLDRVYKSWEKVLPKENIIHLDDYTRLPEAIVSVLQVREGVDPKTVLSSWKGATKKTVEKSIENVVAVVKTPLVATLKIDPGKFKLKPKPLPPTGTA